MLFYNYIITFTSVCFFSPIRIELPFGVRLTLSLTSFRISCKDGLLATSILFVYLGVPFTCFYFLKIYLQNIGLLSNTLFEQFECYLTGF